jgi:hypothetical protein
VAKIEDNIPNFDDLASPDDMIASDEAFAPTEAVTPDAAVVQPEEKPDEKPTSKKGKKEKKEKKAKRPAARSYDEFEPEQKPPFLAIGGGIGILALAIALVFLGYLYLSTALFIIGVAIIPLMIWAGRKTSTVFTVFLGGVLIALMTSAYLLWCVIDRYHGDVKAIEAKQQRTTMAQPPDRDLMRS